MPGDLFYFLVLIRPELADAIARKVASDLLKQGSVVRARHRLKSHGCIALIKADIPGLYKDVIKVTMDNGMLKIQGERQLEKEEQNKRFHRLERFYGSFTRRFSLPEDAEPSAIKAAAEDGQLRAEGRPGVPRSDAAAGVGGPYVRCAGLWPC